MSGDPEIANHLLFAGLDEGFKRAAFAEDLLHVFFAVDVMKLPGVEVVGVQQFE